MHVKKRVIAAVVFLAVFSGLTLLMTLAPYESHAADAHATTLIRPLQTLSGVEVFIAITALGSTTGVILIAAACVYFWRHERHTVYRLLIALIGSSLSVQVIKHVVERARPPALPWLSTLHSYSFPSGHSTSAMVLYGIIAIVCFAHARGPLLKALSLLIPALLIFLIGMSRIVLSAHYFSDVLGGYLLGAFWIAFAFALSFKTNRP